MMLGDITRWQEERRLYPQAVQRAVDYIWATDFSSLTDGRYEIDGERMFALLQSPNLLPAAWQRPESHLVYTDVQFVLAGAEQFGFARKHERQCIVEDRLERQDIVFYGEVHGESVLQLQSGMFAVFFPSDIHRPCCVCEGQEDTGPMRKVVVKVHRELF